MAATEASPEPVQADIVDNKVEVEATKPESASSEETQASTKEAPASTEDVPASTEDSPASTEEAPTSTEETQPTTEAAAAATEQPADSKAKPATEKIWDSFLNKSGLGKVMGGKKKKEQHTEDTTNEEQDKPSNLNDQGDTAGSKDQESTQTAEAGEATVDGQTVEKAPESEEASQDQKASGAKPKQGEKSSVRDFIRNPVAKIFSHKSTDKKDGTGTLQKESKVIARSKSLDRLEDADTSTTVAEQSEEPPSADEPDKSNPQTTKNMKRWHSFKKLMAQKSHKKSTDESKDTEGAEGASADGAGDSGTLDSTTKSEHSGQKKWKLKRSWTFQGLKRDSSVIGIHKPKDKDSSEVKDENASEVDQGTEDVIANEAETLEKTEGDEEKGATGTTQQGKSVDQHANEIWTSFKKRVIPKSKKAADTSGVEEDAAGEQEQTEEPQAGKDSGKSAKAKRTHFNRAVSLKNFILRKGKSSSMDMGETTAAQKDGDGTGESEAKETDGLDDAAGGTDVPQTESEEQATAQCDTNNEAQVVSDGVDSTTSGQPTEKSHAVDPAPESGGQAEPKANGENGCLDGTSEDTAANNHESTTQNDVKNEEINKDTIDTSGKTCLKDGKILNQDGKCDTVNAVAQ
ncbi:hypothetical protein DNTS_011612, partial [Danionella cerebrum]